MATDDTITRRHMLAGTASALAICAVQPASAMGVITSDATTAAFGYLSPWYRTLADALPLVRQELLAAEDALAAVWTPELEALGTEPDMDLGLRFWAQPEALRYGMARSQYHLALERALRPFVKTHDDCAFQEHCEALHRHYMDATYVDYDDIVNGPVRRHARDLVRAGDDTDKIAEADARCAAAYPARQQALASETPLVAYGRRCL